MESVALPTSISNPFWNSVSIGRVRNATDDSPFDNMEYFAAIRVTTAY